MITEDLSFRESELLYYTIKTKKKRLHLQNLFCLELNFSILLLCR